MEDEERADAGGESEEMIRKETLLTRKLQVCGGGNKDFGTANVDPPPVSVLLVDDKELVTFREGSLFCRSSRVVVEGLCLGIC